ncbi:FkbM family methyltransferase [Kiritimatiella glycovorans]|uniref:Methyltransferase, FkbM family n=1 Tax=Kiritimatiella glycovorans TaxID=1307763 RepID=A0A0G3EFB6_9BACT|nr:FkbM family methyltransferase [Kiritimatiella glycovorans]AKJ63475.1 methyltransferase, FkbM family [Kiritimatiella glycovorans]
MKAEPMEPKRNRAADAVLHTCAAVMRRLPYLRGMGTFAEKLNAWMLKAGAQPVVRARMIDGSLMWVDLRTRTEWYAFYRGWYDGDVIPLIRHYLPVGGCFLDVGANIGFYTVPVARYLRQCGPSGCVLSFEPYAGNFERLLQNIRLNGLDAFCDVHRSGLSDASRTEDMVLREDFLEGGETGNASIALDHRFDRGFATVPVRLEPFDALRESGAIPDCRIDVIKVDIEGHEDHFLRGAQRTILRDRPVIFMEINRPYYRVREIDPDEAIPPLLPDGYGVYRRTAGKRWSRAKSLAECRDIEDVIWMPDERSGKRDGLECS